MQYQLAPLYCRPWTLNGMTPRLIESHYEGNYGDALKRLNAVTAELAALDPSTVPVETINRLKRDEAAAQLPISRCSTAPAWACRTSRPRRLSTNERWLRVSASAFPSIEGD